MPSAEIKRHWTRVAELGCIITQRPEPAMHHACGASMTAIIGLKGGALKTSDWLVLPLSPEYHNGDKGIHTIGVRTWESRYWTQVSLLDRLSYLLGYNVWTKVGIDRSIAISKFLEESCRRLSRRFSGEL
jgi:hypothetical protein